MISKHVGESDRIWAQTCGRVELGTSGGDVLVVGVGGNENEGGTGVNNTGGG